MTDNNSHECAYKDKIDKMQKDITKISKGQDEIKEALIGTYDKMGFVTEVKGNTADLKKHAKFNVFIIGAMVVAWIKIVFYK